MLDTLREIQLPVLALMLLLGAAAKVGDRSARGQGPAVLLPFRFRRTFTLVHGGAEAVLAVGLLGLTGLAGDVARVGTAVLFAGGLGALVWLRKRDPEEGCGCFGGLSTAPVGPRSIARAALFAAAALVTIGLGVSGAQVVGGFTEVHAAAAGVELLLVGAVSPELGELAWRAVHREPCEVREVSLRRTLSRLRSSDVWNANAAMVVRREPTDVWRQGCWRLVRFPGRRNGRPVDVVFGVPLSGLRPAVRAAITDVETGVTLAILGELAEHDARPLPRDRGTPGPTGTVVPTRPHEPSQPG